MRWFLQLAPEDRATLLTLIGMFTLMLAVVVLLFTWRTYITDLKRSVDAATAANREVQQTLRICVERITAMKELLAKMKELVERKFI